MRHSANAALLAGVASLGLSALTASSALSQVKRSHSDENLNAIGHRNLAKGPNFYSADKEKELGKVLAQEVERSSRLIDDPVVSDYVNRLAQTIAKNSDAKFPITVRVIDSNEINAFALPGGYQYVNLGLILATESEAELAGVLAHGIAHTAMRSATAQATKGELMQLSSIPAMILMPYGCYEGLNLALYRGHNLAIPLASLKYEREGELVADFYGLQYLYKAGYNAESYPKFLERALPQPPKGQNIPQAFSMMPPLPERLKALNEEITRLLPPRNGEIVSSPEFEVIKERLHNWHPKEVPAPGANPEKPTLRKPTETPFGAPPKPSFLSDSPQVGIQRAVSKS